MDFWHRVVEPAPAEPPGLRRLRAVCADSVGYLETPLLPGGCLMTAAMQVQHDRAAAGRACRDRTRPGPVLTAYLAL
ncbi:TetR family transcriptional regulator C-terminal domain-containing protein [Amycolatopsis sp. NPDC059021]|uniref:TetR family transcriptional regulator C-terminal domain-containing protein n=1 Tax=Amycolatopsis sp. NPDC059021 TaxID=3346704 RepID=UPI00366D55FF